MRAECSTRPTNHEEQENCCLASKAEDGAVRDQDILGHHTNRGRMVVVDEDQLLGGHGGEVDAALPREHRRGSAMALGW